MNRKNSGFNSFETAACIIQNEITQWIVTAKITYATGNYFWGNVLCYHIYDSNESKTGKQHNTKNSNNETTLNKDFSCFQCTSSKDGYDLFYKSLLILASHGITDRYAKHFIKNRRSHSCSHWYNTHWEI